MAEAEVTEIGQQAHAITLQRGEDRDPAQLPPPCATSSLICWRP